MCPKCKNCPLWSHARGLGIRMMIGRFKVVPPFPTVFEVSKKSAEKLDPAEHITQRQK